MAGGCCGGAMYLTSVALERLFFLTGAINSTETDSVAGSMILE